MCKLEKLIKSFSKGGSDMEQLAHDFSTLEPAQPELATIKTTLGELIGAINEEVPPIKIEKIPIILRTRYVFFCGASFFI